MCLLQVFLTSNERKMTNLDVMIAEIRTKHCCTLMIEKLSTHNGLWLLAVTTFEIPTECCGLVRTVVSMSGRFIQAYNVSAFVDK